jgi:Putative zinc-finger
MKCDDCLNLLEAYADGEASEREAEPVRMHLATCAKCEGSFEALTAENEMYARYDRELQVSPALWNGIAARLDSEQEAAATRNFDVRAWFAGLFGAPAFRIAMPAMAVVLIALFVGLAYWRTRPQAQPPVVTARLDNRTTARSSATTDIKPPVTTSSPVVSTVPKAEAPKAQFVATKMNQPPTNKRVDTGSDVLFKDTAYPDGEERDTASHLEQAQNLLVSFRNIQFSENDDEVDVAYEKSESRRLLNENVVLRREAEMTGKYPAKAMLGSLEPFLIDIANLPDKAKPADVRQITDRVQRTEIVAELRGY